MRRTHRGGALGKYLLLLFFLGMLAALFVWKSNYGAIGRVDKLDLASTKDYVAYICENGGKTDLYIVKADGTGLLKLTADGKGKRSPGWSPDGKELCYAAEASDDASVAYQVFILGAGSPRQATYGSTSKDSPRYSPDGNWIGYLSGGCVKIVKPNGKGGRQVYPPPAHVGAPGEEENEEDEAAEGQRKPPIRAFSWAPNSIGIAGVQEAEGEFSIATGTSSWWEKDRRPGGEGVTSDPEAVIVLPSIEGKTTMNLVTGDLLSCCWLPDSRAVVMAVHKEREGFTGLVRQGVDVKGMQPEPLIAGSKATGLLFEHPMITADGKQMAFIVVRQSGLDRETLGIAVQPIAPGQPIRLLTPEDLSQLKLVVKGRVRSPQWSPDGTRLLYILPGAKSKGDVWVCNADGSGATNLTKGAGDCTDAAWSPAVR